MTREHVLIFLGALVLLSPWSGLPMALLKWVLLVLGLSIIGISYMRARKQRMPQAGPPSAEEPHSRSSNIAFS